jgi:hypothetical protein
MMQREHVKRSGTMSKGMEASNRAKTRKKQHNSGETHLLELVQLAIILLDGLSLLGRHCR